MERNGLVAFKLHHGTVLERSEQLFLASGNGYMLHKCFSSLSSLCLSRFIILKIIIAISYCTVMKALKSVVVLFPALLCQYILTLECFDITTLLWNKYCLSYTLLSCHLCVGEGS